MKKIKLLILIVFTLIISGCSILAEKDLDKPKRHMPELDGGNNPSTHMPELDD